jgi:hypothetical protein
MHKSWKNLLQLTGLMAVLLMLALLLPSQRAGAGIIPQTPKDNPKLFLPLVTKKAYPLKPMTLVTAAGGVVVSSDGGARLTFPPGAVRGPMLVSVERSASNWFPGAAAGRAPAIPPIWGWYLDTGLPQYTMQAKEPNGDPISIDKTGFLSLVTITVSLDEANWGGYLVYPYLCIIAQDADSESGCVVDWSKKEIAGQTGHIESFGVFAMDVKFAALDGDAAGNLYYRLGSYLYHHPAGRAPRTLNEENVLASSLPTDSNADSDYDDLALDPGSGTIYLSNGANIYRFTASQQISTLYTSTFGVFRGLFYNAHTGTLFATEVGYSPNGNLLEIDPASGKVLNTLPAGVFDSVVDSKGASYSLYWGDDVGAYNTRRLSIRAKNGAGDAVTGFGNADRLAIDASDNVYVVNSRAQGWLVAGDAVSILAGNPAYVTGFLRVSNPHNLVISGSQMIIATQGGLKTFPLSARTPAPANASVVTTGSLSGRLNAIQLNAPDPLPAHNTLFKDGKPLRYRMLFSADYKSLYFMLPFTQKDCAVDPLPYPAQPAPGLTSYGIKIGQQFSRSFQVQLPDPNFCDWHIPVARGSWWVVDLVDDWGYAKTLLSLTSKENLFPTWVNPFANLDPSYYMNEAAFVVHFPQNGNFTFTAAFKDGTQQTFTVTVTPEGQATQINLQAQIDPVAGGIVRWMAYQGTTPAGALLEIPNGALPGTSPYILTYSSAKEALAGPDQADANSYHYAFYLTPEPAHLNKPLTLRIPYDPAASSKPTIGAAMDSLLGVLVPLPSTLSGGYVNITFPAGDYGATSVGAIQAPQGPAAAAGIRSSLRQIATSVWYATGLANQTIPTAHFRVIYNPSNTSAAYTKVLSDSLEASYSYFLGQGYTVPPATVTARVAPWIANTTRPGIQWNFLGDQYLFFNNQLSSSDLQDTAAHEFYHILQTLSPGYAYMPRWWKEGTSYWAQYSMYPAHTSYFVTWIGSSNTNFPNTSFRAWDTLQLEQMNATMALAEYLEQKKGAGAVRQVSDALATAPDMLTALETVSGDFGPFYREFAYDYWLQKFAPVNTWDLTSATAAVVAAQPVNTVLDQTVGGASSGLVKA